MLAGLGRGKRHHGRQAELLADLQSDQRFAQVVVGLGDDEVDALLGRPAQLLGVHGAHHRGGSRVLGVIGPGVADVACHQGIAFRGHCPGQPHRLPVHRLQVGLTAQLAQLLAVRVIGERHHDISARTQKLPVQLGNGSGEVQHNLGHISARLDIAPALQLEHIALGPQHRAAGKAVRQTRPISCHHRLSPSPHWPILTTLVLATLGKLSQQQPGLYLAGEVAALYSIKGAGCWRPRCTPVPCTGLGTGASSELAGDRG